MEQISEDMLKKDNVYYIENYINYNKTYIKQIGYFSNIIEYPIGRYYNFSYSKDIGMKYSGRCCGRNIFDIDFTKLFLPKKNKLLFHQVLRQKLKDIFLIQYIIEKISFL